MIQCQVVDSLATQVARLEALEKKVQMQKKVDELRKVSSSAA